MCTGTYVDFSPSAPQDFKTQFQKAYNWYICSTRIIEYSFIFGNFCPLIISAVHALITFPADIQEIITNTIPIVLFVFGMISALFIKFRQNKFKDVKNLLVKTDYFIVSPKIDENEMVEVNSIVNIDHTNQHDVNLLQLKYQQHLFSFL